VMSVRTYNSVNWCGAWCGSF